MGQARRFFVTAVSLTMLVAGSALAVAQDSSDATTGARNPQAGAALKVGIEHMQQENWDEAIAAFTQAIGFDDTYPEAYVGRADALRELEDYSSAAEDYQQAILFLPPEPSPLSARAYYGRGVCQREAGQTNLAFNDFNTAIEMDRNDPDIAADLGELLAQSPGEATRALRYLDRAIELDPKNSKAYRNRGLAHAQISEFDESIADLQNSIKLDPTDYETYLTLATVHTAQREFEQAIEAYSHAIENYQPKQSSDPKTFIQGYIIRGQTQLRLALEEETTPERRESLYEAVIADTDQVLAEFPDRFPESGTALHQRGLALRLQGNFSEALVALTDAILLVPPGSENQARYLADAYLKRGICWHYQGQDSLARGDLEQAAGINFEDPLPHLWIGFSYAQEEDYRAAIESYGKAIAEAPAFTTPHVNRGLAYMQLGDFKKAVDNFNEAIRNEPTEAEHYFKRGIAHMRLEEYQKAHDSFKLALLYDKQMEKATRGKAEASSKLGSDSTASQ